MSSKQETRKKNVLPNLDTCILPDGTVVYKHFRLNAHLVRDMIVRDSDVFVTSFPKSGTTWAQEIVWLLTNNLDFDTARRIPLTKRSKFVEFPCTSISEFVQGFDGKRWMEKIDKSTEPTRNFKSHLFLEPAAQAAPTSGCKSEDHLCCAQS